MIEIYCYYNYYKRKKNIIGLVILLLIILALVQRSVRLRRDLELLICAFLMIKIDFFIPSWVLVVNSYLHNWMLSLQLHSCQGGIKHKLHKVLVQFMWRDTAICETPGKVTGQSDAVTDDIALLPITRPTSQSTVSAVNFFCLSQNFTLR